MSDSVASRLAVGALLGGLVGLLLALLGVAQISGLSDGMLLLLAGSCVGALVGWSGANRWLIRVAASLYLVAMLVAFVPWTPLVTRWVREDPLPSRPVDAVVVLSGGLSSDSLLSGNGGDRLLAGLELFRAGVAPRLVTTRVVLRFHGLRVTTDTDQARLIHLAGADSAWLVVDSVAVTHDEATGAARLLEPLGVRDVVVVTEGSHTRRACAAFEKVGFRVWCRPARERNHRTAHAGRPEERLSVFGALAYEALGMVKYRFKGWI